MDSQKIHELEQRISYLEDRLGITPKQANLNKSSYSTSLPHKENTTKQQESSAQNNSSIWNWLKQDWLMKIGAVFLVFAAILFSRYAIVENWITQEMRIILGLSFSLILFAIGYISSKKQLIAGQVLSATGSISFISIMGFARIGYQLYSPIFALISCTLMMLALMAMAIKQNSKPLAIISYLGCAIAPTLASPGSLSVSWIGVYLIIINLSFYALESFKEWHILNPIILFITIIYTPVILNLDGSLPIILFSIFGFFSIFSNLLHAKFSKKKNLIQPITLAFSQLVTLSWILESVSEANQFLVVTVLAILFWVITITWHLMKKESDNYISTINLATASAYTLLATSLFRPNLELNKHAFIAIQSGMIATISLIYFKNKLIANISIIILLLTGLIAFADDIFNGLLWQENPVYFIHSLIISLVIIGLCYLYYFLSKQYNDSALKINGNILAIFSWISGSILFWNLLLNQFSNTSQWIAPIFLISYAIIALILYSIGKTQKRKQYLITALSLFTFIITRLILIDIWNMTILYRFISFAVIGMVLILTAFAYKNNNLIEIDSDK